MKADSSRLSPGSTPRLSIFLMFPVTVVTVPSIFPCHPSERVTSAVTASPDMCAVLCTRDSGRCAATQCANMKRHIRVIGALPTRDAQHNQQVSAAQEQHQVPQRYKEERWGGGGLDIRCRPSQTRVTEPKPASYSEPIPPFCPQYLCKSEFPPYCYSRWKNYFPVCSWLQVTGIQSRPEGSPAQTCCTVREELPAHGLTDSIILSTGGQ